MLELNIRAVLTVAIDRQANEQIRMDESVTLKMKAFMFCSFSQNVPAKVSILFVKTSDHSPKSINRKKIFLFLLSNFQ